VDWSAKKQIRCGYAQVKLCVALLSYVLAGAASASDIFVSPAADGGHRYASQALDSSYRLIYSDHARLALEGSTTPFESKKGKVERLQPAIRDAAHRYKVSAKLLEAVISVESNFDATAVSPKGAHGPMQLMPSTAARYGLIGPQAQLDPERNIDAGTRHLRDLLARYDGNVVLALAAYNAGSGAVARHRDRVPPYRETMLYVPAVLARSAAQPARE
jgi:soluble lytic murein transglycosylase-like protein